MYLANYSASRGLTAKLAVKLEYFNPLGSIKDRAAYAMVVDAEKRGLVKEGTVIIEPDRAATPASGWRSSARRGATASSSRCPRR